MFRVKFLKDFLMQTHGPQGVCSCKRKRNVKQIPNLAIVIAKCQIVNTVEKK
jgi:hypothetical protein